MNTQTDEVQDPRFVWAVQELQEQFIKWMSEIMDMSENIFPAALKGTNWCNVTVAQAFNKAHYLELTLSKTTCSIIHALMKKSLRSKKGIICTSEAFQNAGDTLFLRFSQNPMIMTNLYGQLTISYAQFFGEERYRRIVEKANAFFGLYNAISTILQTESSEKDSSLAKLFANSLEHLPSGKRMEKLQILLDSNESYYSLLTSLLAIETVKFRNEIVEAFTIRISQTKFWNAYMGDRIFYGVPIASLLKACQVTSSFLKLLVEYINETCAKSAVQVLRPYNSEDAATVSHRPYIPHYFWELGDSNQTMKDIQRLFQHLEPCGFMIRNYLAALPQYNPNFWSAAFQPPAETE